MVRSAAVLRDVDKPTAKTRPSSAEELQEGIRALLRHLGEDPDRPGLEGMPARVLHAFEELFAGYRIDPLEYLRRTFEEIEGYDGMVLLKGIPFVSHGERDMGVFQGEAHIAYMPRHRVVGLSKLPRVVDALAQRLQTQERLTVEIADAIETGLEADGVAVVMDAAHLGLAARGVRKPGTRLQTSCMRGRFRTEPGLRSEFLGLIRTA